MDSGQLGGFNHFLRIDVVKTSDVLGNAASEQFDILRQITDEWPQFVFIPLVNIGIIKPHNTFADRPDTYQQTRQRGLTGSAWPDNPQNVPRLDREADIM
ncbi:hypothetical protein D3C81_1121090 [compost metagenome]